MLKAIKNISGVGLFCRAESGANLPLEQVTLIYGENGRGKSTLASTLSAAGSGDVEKIKERATIDSTNAPFVDLLLEDETQVKFARGAWRGTLDNVRVFDSHFIEENVHSGHEITSDHRKNLLTFALGSRAVKAQKDEREASASMKQIDEKLKLEVAELLAHTQGLSEHQFTSLPKHNDIDSAIKSAATALETAMARSAIANQPLPARHVIPVLDIDSIFSVLSMSLEDVHDSAEKEVMGHLAVMPSEGAAQWIADGQAYLEDEMCPFCGQSISGVSLIESYRTHFNQAYQDLKARVSSELESVKNATDESVVKTFEKSISAAKQAIESWKDTGLSINDPGVVSIALMEADLLSFREAMIRLLQAKLQNVAEVPQDNADEVEIRSYWTRFRTYVAEENKIIDSALKEIKDFKATLATADLDALKSKLKTLELSRIRHSQQIEGKIKSIEASRNDLAKAETARKKSREELKQIMDTTLGQFADDINAHLEKQFASFRIDKLSANYKGGTPRTEYGIKLRDREVSLTRGKQSFRTALSESDKRTMAFAFFLASTLSDPDLKDRIIVVDDPMSSLDRNRRANTVAVLKSLAEKCKQLIVLAHDPKFLLDVDTAMRKVKVDTGSGREVIQRAHLKLALHNIDSSLDPYSDFKKCDLARECESTYAMNYRKLADFVKNPSKDPWPAASAIRPLLEGYLHRRFPNHLPVNCMFGEAVTAIEEARGDSPLVAGQKIVPELRRIASFGNEPHHDTNPDRPGELLSATEIHGYVKEALVIVHGG